MREESLSAPEPPAGTSSAMSCGLAGRPVPPDPAVPLPDSGPGLACPALPGPSSARPVPAGPSAPGGWSAPASPSAPARPAVPASPSAPATSSSGAPRPAARFVDEDGEPFDVEEFFSPLCGPPEGADAWLAQVASPVADAYLASVQPAVGGPEALAAGFSHRDQVPGARGIAAGGCWTPWSRARCWPASPKVSLMAGWRCCPMMSWWG